MLFHLAKSNIRENRKSYTSFFLSSVFAVAAFYMFTSFRMHPDLASGAIMYREQVEQTMKMSGYTMVAFSFFFIWYANSSFLRSRKREFGLLSLLGATRKQINTVVFLETAINGLLSILTGIAVGTVLFKLFLMIMGHLLDVESPIRLLLVPKAIFTTFITFAAAFILIGILNTFVLKNAEIIQLVRAPQKAQQPPKFSRILAVSAVIMIAAGYYLAWTMTPHVFMAVALPILFLVCTGTWLLFRQASVAVLRRLQSRRDFYMRSTNLMTISDLVFKMRDNANVLANVAILSAVVITASGTSYAFHGTIVQQPWNESMHTFSYIIQDGDNLERLANRVENALTQHGTRPITRAAFKALKMTPVDAEGCSPYPEGYVIVMPEQDYNDWARQTSAPEARMDYGHAVFAGHHETSLASGSSDSKMLHLLLGDQSFALAMDGQAPGEIVNWNIDNMKGVVVVDDDQYVAIANSPAGAEDRIYVMAYKVSDWKSAGKAWKEIKNMIPESQVIGYWSDIELCTQYTQMSALTLFVGLFMAALFFLASGSMLYFKMFTDLQDDKMRYEAAERIGLSPTEVRVIVDRELALIFFAPCVVGIVHSTFAFKSLSILMDESSAKYGIVAIGAFVIAQLAYFLASRRVYVDQLSAAR